ncbi:MULTISPECIES: NUDIX hydrolase [Microbulbifer]|uniref:NUDIX domain-containing protein n=1 Tax=Microbulbifer celer TaxID=435905 RepID=A0ABW3U8J6_9GAMM|nr:MULTISPECIES: NUDIX domain-containing protein [Microbulbifer]UFN56339.1 NUDIX domain-containing protein [Microbulbifer celer]
MDSPRHALTVDNVIFGLDDGELKVLTVKYGEGKSSGRWALPGDWLQSQETLEQAASRVLLDRTGVKDIYLEQLHTFSALDRHPGERIITVAFYALVRSDAHVLSEGHDNMEARWVNVRETPGLIYDHSEILDIALARLKHKVRHEPIGFNLLPEKFTLLELQRLYEAILDTKLDKPNFRRKMMKMNLLVSTDEKQSGVSYRAANLYRFDRKVYNELTEQGFVFEV